MRWFKRPEEYLTNFRPTGPVYEKRCPLCGEADPAKYRYSRSWLWKNLPGKCLTCRRRFRERELVKVGERTKTREEAVLTCLQNDLQLALALGVTAPRRGPVSGLLGAAAQVGMYSHNGTYARESIVYTVQDQVQRIQQQSAAYSQRDAIIREYEYALHLADEYFHGEQRRQAAAQAKATEVAMLGEAIVDAMARRVEDQRRH